MEEIFAKKHFHYLLKDISEIDLTYFKKNQLAYKIIIDLLSSSFKSDPKIMPGNVITLLNLLIKLKYKEPQLYLEIIIKYNEMFDLFSQITHLIMIKQISILDPLNFDIKRTLSILDTENLEFYNKCHVFNSIIILNVTDLITLDFFLKNFAKNIKFLKTKELLSILLSLIKLSQKNNTMIVFVIK